MPNFPYLQNLDSMTHDSAMLDPDSPFGHPPMTSGNIKSFVNTGRSIYQWCCFGSRYTDRMEWLFRTDNHPRQAEHYSRRSLDRSLGGYGFYPDITSAVRSYMAPTDPLRTAAIRVDEPDLVARRFSATGEAEVQIVAVDDDLPYISGHRFLVEYLVVALDDQWFYAVPQRVVLYVPKPTWGRGWIAIHPKSTEPSSCPRVWATPGDEGAEKGSLGITDLVLPVNAQDEVCKEYMRMYPTECWHHMENRPKEEMLAIYDQTEALLRSVNRPPGSRK